MISTAVSLLRKSPAWRLTIALSAGLTLALFIILFAMVQPRFGLSFVTRGAAVMVSGAPVDRIGAGHAVRALAVLAPDMGAVPLTPQTLMEEPNFLPDFPAIRLFMSDQDKLASMMRGQPGLLIDAQGVRHVVTLRQSDHGELPFAFWYQLFVGTTVYAISIWLWAIAPGNRPNLLFAVSGIAMLLSAGSAAIYSTRELALDGHAFRILGIVNELGASLFGIAMAHLFLIYPRKLVSARIAWLLWIVFGIWTAAGAARLVPSPSWGNNGTTIAEMAIIVAAVAWQYRATRGDPVGRSALRWLGIGTVVGSGAFISTAIVPLLFDRPALIDQGMAFGFFLIIVAGVAMGLRRDRLFAVDRLSYAVLFYSSAAALFFLFDISMIYLLGSQSYSGVVTGAVLLPLLYLPVRDRAIAWISGSGRPDVARILEDVTRINFVREGAERTQMWRESLDHAFQPLAIEPTADVLGVSIVEDGAALAVPSVAGAPPLRLRLAARGRSLFGQQERVLAERMVAMAARADAERIAHERGIDEERARVARDLHDDLAARLMDGLARDQVEGLRETIRLALAEVRSIVNGPSGIATLLADALADARVEASERLEVAGIKLDWTPAPLGGRLSPAQARALGSAIREAVTNITRHSGASCVAVYAGRAGDLLTMTIADDGRGAAGPEPAMTGNGLRNVSYRIGSVGGAATFASSDNGFRVTITLPVEESDA